MVLSEKHIFCKEKITDKNTLLYMIYVKYNMGVPGGSVVKNLPASAGDSGEEGLIPGWGRSTGKGNGNPLQYSCLENPADRGDCWATQFTGLQRVGHNWATEQQQQHNIIYTYTHTYFDRKLHSPFPVLIKGKQLGVGNFRLISALGWESASDWKRKNSFLTKMVRRWWRLTSPPPALGCQILTAWKLREMLD